MDFSIEIKAIRMGLSIIYFKGSQVITSHYDAFLFLMIVFTQTYSVDPDEMLNYAAFHLGFSVCHSTHFGHLGASVYKELNSRFLLHMGQCIRFWYLLHLSKRF